MLEMVLVPDEDKLYDLPVKWMWVNLKSCVSSIQYGYTEVSSKKEIGPKFLRITDIQNDKVSWNKVPYCKIEEHELEKYKLEDNDIVVARTGATTGKSYLISTPPVSVFASYLIRLRCKEIMSPKYLWEFMKSPIYWQQITVVKKGSAQPGANAQILGNLLVPLPPLNEQKRIAKKVEYLLNKVEEAKRLIKEARETYEVRRAAIFEKAFRGELTRKWREQNLGMSTIVNKQKEGPYKIPNQWDWTTVGEITTFVGSGSTPSGGSKVYQSQGIPFIRSQNVLKNKMSIDDIVFIAENTHNNMKRTHMQGNETLLNITGASIGRAAKLKKELVPCNLNQHVCALRFIDEINEELPQYWLNSLYLQKVINEMQIGATRQALNFPQVKSLPFPVIPKEEQKELLKIINTILTKEENLRLLEDIDIKINLLKQTILYKAFRGELGTDDPAEKSIIETLIEFLQNQIK
jgi:type I restriction enzyme, S subunit